MKTAPFAALVGLILLGGCTPPENADPTALDGPMFGPRRETTFYLGTNDPLKVRDIVAVAKIIRRYKTLDAAEQDLARLAIRRGIDLAIAKEVARIKATPRYKKEIARIAAIPDRRAAAREEAALETRTKDEATALANHLHELVAAHFQTADNLSIITFGKRVGSDIKLAGDAYEADQPPARIGPGTTLPLPAEAASSLGAKPGVSVTVVGAGTPWR